MKQNNQAKRFPPRTEILTHLGEARKHHAFAVLLTGPLMCPPRKSKQSLETLRMCSVLGGTRKHFNFCDSRSWHQLPARGGLCHLRDLDDVHCGSNSISERSPECVV